MVTDDAMMDPALRWQVRQRLGLSGEPRLTRLGEGQSNPTYLVSGEGRNWVLRSKPPGPLLKSAHLVEREFRIMNGLNGTGVPVPNMIALIEDAQSPTGRAYFLMEHVEGRIFRDPGLGHLSPTERDCVYDGMNRILASLHDVDPAHASLARRDRSGTYCVRQTALWTEQYRRSATQLLPVMGQVFDWLGRHHPPTEGDPVIVHGDYRIDNMIFHPVHPEPVALIDWELASLGNPFADLAYQCAQWRLPHTAILPGLAGLDREVLMIPDERAYVARYCDRRRIDTPTDWRYFLVFSLYRLASILAGVARRAHDGNAANPRLAAGYGSQVATVADLAMEIAETTDDGL